MAMNENRWPAMHFPPVNLYSRPAQAAKGKEEVISISALLLNTVGKYRVATALVNDPVFPFHTVLSGDGNALIRSTNELMARVNHKLMVVEALGHVRQDILDA
jgi:hypothetical protein